MQQSLLPCSLGIRLGERTENKHASDRTVPARHEQLLEHIEHIARPAREMPRLSRTSAPRRERILGFLRDTLVARQGRGESLYPEWAALVGFAMAVASRWFTTTRR